MYKIKRALKRGEINMNTNAVTINLEDKLKEFFEKNNNTVFIDNHGYLGLAMYADYHNTIKLYNTIGIITGFDDETYDIDLTGFGETFFEGHIVDGFINDFTVGISYVVDETNEFCERIIKLYLISEAEEQKAKRGSIKNDKTV